jgi:hypothetical protein
LEKGQSGFRFQSGWNFEWRFVMKRLLSLVISVCLVFGLSALTMAEGKSVYVEYEKEKDAGNYGPTLGFDWEIADQWTLSLSHQLKGDGENEAVTSLEADYTLSENLTAKLTYETSKDSDDVVFEFDGSYVLKDPWSLIGGLTYTAYTPDKVAGQNPDYNELELAAGVECQITKALVASLQYKWTDTTYDDNVLDAADGGNNDAFEVDAEYNFGKYAVYLECEIPDNGYDATLGLAYKF